MSREIRVGDRVKCIDTSISNILVLNEIYTISEIFEGRYLVFREIEQSHNYSPSDFELVEDRPVFKVGDIITGVANSGHYPITSEAGTYQVLGLRRDGFIKIEAITHSIIAHVGYIDTVEPQFFNLVTPAKPNLDTLIKRIQLGRRAAKELLEHYNDDVKIREAGFLYSANFYFDSLIDIEFKKVTNE